LANHTITKQRHPQLRRADENIPCCANSRVLSAKEPELTHVARRRLAPTALS
jgi:hypothetical protein